MVVQSLLNGKWQERWHAATVLFSARDKVDGDIIYPDFEGLLPSDISVTSKVISQLIGRVCDYSIYLSDIGVMS